MRDSHWHNLATTLLTEVFSAVTVGLVAWTIMGSMGWLGQPGRSWVAWVGQVSLDDHG